MPSRTSISICKLNPRLMRTVFATLICLALLVFLDNSVFGPPARASPPANTARSPRPSSPTSAMRRWTSSSTANPASGTSPMRGASAGTNSPAASRKAPASIPPSSVPSAAASRASPPLPARKAACCDPSTTRWKTGSATCAADLSSSRRRRWKRSRWRSPPNSAVASRGGGCEQGRRKDPPT